MNPKDGAKDRAEARARYKEALEKHQNPDKSSPKKKNKEDKE